MHIGKPPDTEIDIGIDAEAPPSMPGGFDLIGTLRPNPEDGLADFVVLREPSPFEGPA